MGYGTIKEREWMEEGGRGEVGEEGNKNFITIRETLEILIHLGLESPSLPSPVSMLLVHLFIHLLI